MFQFPTQFHVPWPADNKPVTMADHTYWVADGSTQLVTIAFANGDFVRYRFSLCADILTLEERLMYHLAHNQTQWRFSSPQSFCVKSVDGSAVGGGEWIDESRLLWKGKLTVEPHHFLEGSFCGLLAHGPVVWNEQGVRHYDGSCWEGKRHGFGRETTHEDVYEGMFVHHQRQGWGKRITAQEVFEGIFFAGVAWGKGRLVSDKVVIEGEWKDKVIDASCWRGDDGHYEGRLRNGLFHGQGRRVWNDYKSYEGEWVDGKRQGEGVLTDGPLVYHGHWFQDERQGRGKCWKLGELIYEGEWSHNQRHGGGSGQSGNVWFRGHWMHNRPMRGLWHFFGQRIYLEGIRMSVCTYVGDHVGVGVWEMNQLFHIECFGTSVDVLQLCQQHFAEVTISTKRPPWVKEDVWEAWLHDRTATKVNGTDGAWRWLQLWFDPDQLTALWRPFPCDGLIPRWVRVQQMRPWCSSCAWAGGEDVYVDMASWLRWMLVGTKPTRVVRQKNNDVGGAVDQCMRSHRLDGTTSAPVV